jgi:hypothetical protein
MTGIFSERGGLLLNIKIRFLNQARIVTNIHTFSVHMCVMTQGIVEWIDPLFELSVYVYFQNIFIISSLPLCNVFVPISMHMVTSAYMYRPKTGYW